MLKNKIKILHLYYLLIGIILITKYEFILDSLKFGMDMLKLLSRNFTAFKALLNFSVLEILISLFFLLLIIVSPPLSKKFRKILNLKLTLVSFLLSVLLLFALLTPVTATFNPNQIRNIGETKLLPPLSMFYAVKLKDKSGSFDEITGIRKEGENLINHGITNSTILVKNIQIDNNNIKLNTKSGTKIYRKDEVESVNTKLFLFGTDEYGRDIFSRIIYGTRLAFVIGLGSVFVSVLVGISLGIFAGFVKGFFDSVSNRIAEMFLAFPFLFLIILIIALFGNSVFVIILVLGISGWMSLFKIIRNEIINLSERDFIITSKNLGISKTKIFFKEMFPVIISPIIVNLVLQFGNVIMAESALSYLGLGVSEDYSSWGSMINAGQYYLTNAWWMSLFPSLFLFFVLYSANKLGHNLEKIFNPLTSK